MSFLGLKYRLTIYYFKSIGAYIMFNMSQSLVEASACSIYNIKDIGMGHYKTNFFKYKIRLGYMCFSQ